MVPRTLLFLAMLPLASAALGQKLECAPAAAPLAQPCETFHYHVLMYRPDTRGFAEISATPQFASASACERARAAAIRTNLAIVDFFKRVRNEQQYEPDRFGTCHCDMTIEKSSPNFLTDASRIAQIRLAEDIRLHVREHLLDADLTSDSELVRSLATPVSNASLLAGPKLVPLPSKSAAASVENPTSDLRATKVADATTPGASSVDLPLVDVVTDAATMASPAPSQSVIVVERPAEPPVAAPPPSPTPTPAPASAYETTEAPAPDPAAEEAAEAFITYETQRIQNVLKASGAIADESVKSKIFEACMQRIQLLSNLRRLIQGSGFRSRLAKEARNAKTEADRQKFIGRLFGSEMWPHWAPKDAADVIIAPRPDIDTNPDSVLRDASGRYSIAQRRHALYVMLARAQPTEDQQLWLTTLVDSFLQ